jgi:hypothetical protein
MHALQELNLWQHEEASIDNHESMRKRMHACVHKLVKVVDRVMFVCSLGCQTCYAASHVVTYALYYANLPCKGRWSVKIAHRE